MPPFWCATGGRGTVKVSVFLNVILSAVPGTGRDGVSPSHRLRPVEAF
uniref:Uncharacterized protein n=1 Tax=uncultured Armatimonadetes bacterium TaxID=157466 RepID=A0A6J4H7H9_9BACT|nr:hypothetical protein AVDCRST_MAG63-283 [uncultured Armatimonadetes bacterium]